MDLRRIDLNGLVALDALLTECSVTRAAEQLGIGQPAASAALSRMRKLFDDPLLVKDGRGLRRTHLAASLVEPLRDVLSTIDGLVSMSETFDPATARRTFSMVASDYVSVVYICSLLAQLEQRAPNIRLNVTPMTALYADHLRRGEVDFAVIPRELVDAPREFGQLPLFDDGYVGAVWSEHSEVGDTFTREQMSKLPYLMYAPPGQTSIVESQLDKHGIKRNVEVTTSSIIATPFMLPGTRLYTMIHRRLADRLAGLAPIRQVESAVPLMDLQENLYWPRHLTHDPGHRWMREQMAEVASRL